MITPVYLIWDPRVGRLTSTTTRPDSFIANKPEGIRVFLVRVHVPINNGDADIPAWGASDHYSEAEEIK